MNRFLKTLLFASLIVGCGRPGSTSSPDGGTSDGDAGSLSEDGGETDMPGQHDVSGETGDSADELRAFYEEYNQLVHEQRCELAFRCPTASATFDLLNPVSKS